MYHLNMIYKIACIAYVHLNTLTITNNSWHVINLDKECCSIMQNYIIGAWAYLYL